MYFSNQSRKKESNVFLKKDHNFTKCHKLAYASLCVIFLAVLVLLPKAAFSAIVEGEEIPRLVDTPTGTIETTEMIINAGPNNNEEDSSDANPGVEAQAAPDEQQKAVTSNEMPEAPNFEADVPNQKPEKKNSNTTLIVIGALIAIIGIGIVLFIAKSREK